MAGRAGGVVVGPLNSAETAGRENKPEWFASAVERLTRLLASRRVQFDVEENAEDETDALKSQLADWLKIGRLTRIVERSGRAENLLMPPDKSAESGDRRPDATLVESTSVSNPCRRNRRLEERT